MRKTKSIGTVLILSVTAVILLAVTGILLYINTSTYRLTLEKEKSGLRRAGDAAQVGLDEYQEAATSLVHTMATDDKILGAFRNGDPNAAQTRIASMVSANSDVWCLLAFDAKGRVIAGATARGNDIRGQSRADRDYYKSIMAGKQLYLAKTILRSKSDRNINIFSAVQAIHGDDGKAIGGVGVLTRWGAFTERFIDSLRFGQRGYAFVIDKTGRIIAHGKDSSLLLRDVSSEDFIRRALHRKNGELFYDWKGERKYLCFSTDPDTGFLIGMSAAVSDLAKPATDQRNALTGIGLAAVLALGCLVALLVRKLVVRPINQLRDYSAAIGRGEYGAKRATGYRFELADLARNLHGMVDQLKERLGFSQGVLNGFVLPCAVFDKDNKTTFVNAHMLRALGKDGAPADYLGKTSGDMIWGQPERSTVSRRAMAAGRMIREEIVYPGKSGERIFDVTSTPIKDLNGAVTGTLAVWFDLTEIRAQQEKLTAQGERIAKAAAAAEGISDQVASAAEELAAQIEQSSRGAEEQRKRTAEAATAMTEMNSTVMEVAQNAGAAAELAEKAKAKATEGSEVVGNAEETINGVREQAEGLRGDMGKLGKMAEGIGEVLGVITDIADQTNLLALNAAIEAARAGDAGRGFAVVADEVRKLAEKTMTATKQVDEAVKDIQKSARDNIRGTEQTVEAVTEATEMADRSGDALNEIVGIVDQTADQVRGIATASEEQSAASEEIGRTTEQINTIAGQTSEAMTQSARAVSNLSRLAQELRAIIADMNGQG